MKYVVVRRHGWLVICSLVVAVALGGVLWRGAVGQDRTSEVDPGAVAQAKSLSRAFRAAANAVMPTVVKISVSTKPQRIQTPEGRSPRRNPFEGTPFEDFFDEGDSRFHGFQFRDFTPRRQGVGSGVIIDQSGIVLTNNHVVAGADKVLVELSDGRRFEAVDVKTDPQSDLAVVRIETDQPLPAAVLGDSDKMEIGDWVLAVGNPFELAGTVSAGIISGKGRSLRAGGQSRFSQRTEYLQTDAAINPGNSGGPLVNLDGEVVGINTAIASNTGGYQGVGFAIPSNLAKWVADQLIDNGSVQRAYLGVSIGLIDDQLAAKLGVRQHQGVLVSEVLSGTPAEKAGFRAGDVILAFAGQAVGDPRQLQAVVERSPAGSKQRVDVMRSGKPLTLQVVVKPLPDDFDRASTPSRRPGRTMESQRSKSEELGLEVGALTEELAKKLDYEGLAGVVITEVDPDGIAAEAGIRPGALILQVGFTPVKSAAEFKAAVKAEDLGKGVMLLIRTGGRQHFVVLRSS